ncbi:MAG: hypothetical protein ACRDJC_13720, partial [Thermomicrobiales bacterium]
AAMVIGAMLLLVTSSDLLGMPPQPAQWLSEPEVPPVEFLSAPAPEAAAPPRAAAPAVDTDAAFQPAAPESESRQEIASGQSQGTTGDDSASQEVLTDEEAPPRTAPAFATTAAIAAMTQAVPTAAAAPAREPETTPAVAPASPGDQPSRLRLVQIALALGLAWLIVSIVGLRWVRGLR